MAGIESGIDTRHTSSAFEASTATANKDTVASHVEAGEVADMNTRRVVEQLKEMHFKGDFNVEERIEQMKQSVVGIRVTKRLITPTFDNGKQRVEVPFPSKSGTGFLVAPNVIMTNMHVVANASSQFDGAEFKIEIFTAGGDVFEAEFDPGVKQPTPMDAAYLRIKGAKKLPSNVQMAEIGRSEDVQKRDIMVAVGGSNLDSGYRPTAKAKLGIVVEVHKGGIPRKVRVEEMPLSLYPNISEDDRYVVIRNVSVDQQDFNIHGDSGGPIFNLRTGKVVFLSGNGLVDPSTSKDKEKMKLDIAQGIPIEHLRTHIEHYELYVRLNEIIKETENASALGNIRDIRAKFENILSKTKAEIIEHSKQFPGKDPMEIAAEIVTDRWFQRYFNDYVDKAREAQSSISGRPTSTQKKNAPGALIKAYQDSFGRELKPFSLEAEINTRKNN